MARERRRFFFRRKSRAVRRRCWRMCGIMWLEPGEGQGHSARWDVADGGRVRRPIGMRGGQSGDWRSREGWRSSGKVADGCFRIFGNLFAEMLGGPDRFGETASVAFADFGRLRRDFVEPNSGAEVFRAGVGEREAGLIDRAEAVGDDEDGPVGSDFFCKIAPIASVRVERNRNSAGAFDDAEIGGRKFLKTVEQERKRERFPFLFSGCERCKRFAETEERENIGFRDVAQSRGMFGVARLAGVAAGFDRFYQLNLEHRFGKKPCDGCDDIGFSDSGVGSGDENRVHGSVYGTAAGAISPFL